MAENLVIFSRPQRTAASTLNPISSSAQVKTLQRTPPPSLKGLTGRCVKIGRKSGNRKKRWGASAWDFEAARPDRRVVETVEPCHIRERVSRAGRAHLVHVGDRAQSYADLSEKLGEADKTRAERRQPGGDVVLDESKLSRGCVSTRSISANLAFTPSARIWTYE